MGGLALTYRNSTVELEHITLTPDIEAIGILNPTFEGVLQITGDVHLYNSGSIPLQNIDAEIEVDFDSVLIPNSKVLIASGVITFEEIPSKTTVTQSLELDATLFIPRLAIEDGSIIISVEAKILIQFIPTFINLSKEVEEPWEAPFF